MAKKTYSYGEAPTDTTKKVTKTVYEYKPLAKKPSQDEQERRVAAEKMSNDDMKKKYGLDNSSASASDSSYVPVKRKDVSSFKVNTMEEYENMLKAKSKKQ